MIGPFLSEIFFSRFSRFVNFASRYGGVLSQVVNLISPGKIAKCTVLAFTYLGKKKQENLEEKKSAKKDRKIRKFEILDQKFFD